MEIAMRLSRYPLSSLLFLLFFAFLPLFVIPPPGTDPYGQLTWNGSKILALLLFVAFVFGGYPRLLVPPRDLVGTLLLLGMVLLALSALRLLFQGVPLKEVLLGNPYRSSGHGVHFLFLLAGTAFWNFVRENEERAIAFFYLLPFAGAVEGAIVIAQALGWEPLLLLRISPRSSFPVGTVGHPGMVAPFLSLTLMALLGTWKGRGAERFLLLFLLSLALGLALNRASLIAFTFAVSLFWFRTRTRVAPLALLLVWVGALGYQSIPALGYKPFPKPDKELASSTTFQTRVHLWAAAAQLASRAPWELLWGYGDWGGARAADRHGIPLTPFLRFLSLERGLPPPEDLKDAIPQKTDLGFQGYVLLYEGGWGKAREVARPEEMDRFHNAFLDMAFAFGIPFALVWTVLLFGPIVLLKRGRVGEVGEAARMGLLALFLYSLAWFPVVATEMALFSFALSAFVLALSEAKKGDASTPPLASP
jgi:O-antigen ligase